MHSRACLPHALSSSLLWQLWVRRLKGLRCSPLRNAVDEHGTPRCLGSWKTQCIWLRVRGRPRGAPDYLFQQCTIAPIMQGVTRDQLHNDTEHSSRKKVRFAAEDDVQFIAASSQRAEINDITGALVQFRNDIAQVERDGLLVPHFHQQCDDLEARIAVFSVEVIPAFFMRLCLNSLLYTSAFRHFVTVQFQLYSLHFLHFSFQQCAHLQPTHDL